MHGDFNTKLVNACTTKQHQKFQHRSNIDPSLSSCSQFTSLYLYLSTYYLSGCVQVLGHVHILFNENKCKGKSKEEGGDENLL